MSQSAPQDSGRSWQNPGLGPPFCALGWAGVVCSVLKAHGVLVEVEAEVKTRLQAGPGGLGKWGEAREERKKSKDESTPSSRRRRSHTSPVATSGAGVASEPGLSASPTLLATCFLGTRLFLPNVKPLGKAAGGGSGRETEAEPPRPQPQVPCASLAGHHCSRNNRAELRCSGGMMAWGTGLPGGTLWVLCGFAQGKLPTWSPSFPGHTGLYFPFSFSVLTLCT